MKSSSAKSNGVAAGPMNLLRRAGGRPEHARLERLRTLALTLTRGRTGFDSRGPASRLSVVS